MVRREKGAGDAAIVEFAWPGELAVTVDVRTRGVAFGVRCESYDIEWLRDACKRLRAERARLVDFFAWELADRCETMRLPFRTVGPTYRVGDLSDFLLAAVNEAGTRARAARTIVMAAEAAVLSPHTHLGRARLLREFAELSMNEK